MTSTRDLAALARRLIDTSRYMVLGTMDPDGRPRVSPVYYAPDGYQLLYWLSSPDAHHSRNLAEHPEVSMVVFNSTAPIGAGQAAYLIARAEQVPDADLEGCADVACRARFPEQDVFAIDKLRHPAPLRLYRAHITEHSVRPRQRPRPRPRRRSPDDGHVDLTPSPGQLDGSGIRHTLRPNVAP